MVDFHRLCQTLAVFGRDFGSLWQTLTGFGRLWQTFIDFHKLCQAFTDFDRFLQTLADFDRHLYILTDFVIIWQNVAIFGRLRQSLV
jgi:hypothetical protein